MLFNNKVSVMKEIGSILKKIKKEIYKNLVSGKTGLEIDSLASNLIKKYNAEPAFLGYLDFPNSICFSNNSELIHGIPNSTPINDGDLVSVDIGIKYKGYYGDTAFSKIIGNKDTEISRNLLETTQMAIDEVVNILKPNIKTGDIGNLISDIAKSKNLFYTKKYVGHGIGKELHESPMIPNYGKKNDGDIIEEGMVICVEPMFLEGTDETFIDPLDNTTVRNKLGKLSCHVEDMILITKNGCLRLT